MMQDDSKEISLRSTDTMQRAVEPVIERSMIKSKKDFVSTAVTENIGYVYSKLAGHKNIRDFTKDLNNDVEWINITLPQQSIQSKLEPDKSLDVLFRSEIPSKYYSTIKDCSRSSGLSKSSIVRICMLKHLNEMSEFLPEVRALKVEQRWISVKAEIEMLNAILIDRLYYVLDHGYIRSKLNDDLEVKSIYYISEYYKEFRYSKGYEVMKENNRGKQVINILESVLEKTSKT